MLTNSSKALIELKDGGKIYTCNDTVKHAPGMEVSAGTRFDAYTWSYFFLLPYKLTDPGTHWAEHNGGGHNQGSFEAGMLRFDEGIGDTPKDWYVVYADKATGRLNTAAYIVTAGASVDEAEADPHAIVYDQYKLVNGIPVATEWSFYSWTEAEGLGQKLGRGTVSNIEFIDVHPERMDAPEGYAML